MNKMMTAEELKFSQEATITQCTAMIDEISKLLIKFLHTKVYEIKVKDYMICNSIIWRLCNEDEADSLR